jgi:putative transposase
MNKYYQPLFPGETYHLFSRAVGNEKLFISAENYRYFLQQLKKHTAPVCNVYCYALLPNHFHLLARIKQEDEITGYFKEVKKCSYHPEQHNLPDFIMERFSNCLNSYTKAFNKMYHRKGALFMDYLKRSIVNKDNDFTTYTLYIHKNPVHHRLTNAPGEWPHDSYRSILSDHSSSLLRNEVIDWFGGKERFIQFHQQAVYPKILSIDL